MILIWLVKFFHVFVLVNNMIFDTHIHLNDGKYTNLDILIKEAKELGINAFLCIGYDLESSKKAIEIAENLLDVLDNETISLKTGLSLEEIEKLRRF